VTPCDFFWFPSKILQLRRLNFQEIHDIQKRKLTALYAIPKNQLQHCFYQ